MCEYCDEKNEMSDFEGSDGIAYNPKDGKYYLIIEHFRNERNSVEVKYCTECGRSLESMC